MSSLDWCAIKLTFCKRCVRFLSFFFSCPEWEKTHRSPAPRETRQLCCLNPKDLYSQGPEQPTHRHTNLYLWFRNGCLQVSVSQGRWVKPVLSAPPSFFCRCYFNRGLLVFCVDPVYWSRGCWSISSSRLFRVMELCSWPLTQRYSYKTVKLYGRFPLILCSVCCGSTKHGLHTSSFGVLYNFSWFWYLKKIATLWYIKCINKR